MKLEFDCFVNTILIFMRDFVRDGVNDPNELKEKFDDVVLLVHVEEDVFSIFSKVCIVCCKTAL